MSTSRHQPPIQTHPVARGVTWVAGIVATLLSGLLVLVGITAVSEWSTYEGGESSIALTVVGFFAVTVLLAWTLTALAFKRTHN